MKGIVVLTCLLAVGMPDAVTCQVSTADEAPSGFEALKELVGQWEGLSWDGTPGTVNYHLTGAGTSLVETLLPRTSQEMMTVYHENAAGELVGTHYCTAGNQPEIELTRHAEGVFVFELSPDDQNVGEGEVHGHEFTLALPSADSLILDWSPWRGETPLDTRRYRFRRVR